MGSLAIQPNSRHAYALALLLLTLAVGAQWAMRPVVGMQVPFLFFLPAVGAAAMWGGWRPALLVLAGGFLNTFFWFGVARGARLDPAAHMALAGYLVAAGLLLAMGGRISQLRARAADAEDTLVEQVDDLQVLHDLNARVALLPELPEQLQAILETLCQLQGADKGLVSLCDKGAESLRMVASVGFGTASLQGELLAVPLVAGACGRADAGRQPVVVSDTETDERFAPYRELARREQFRAVHSRPLLQGSGEVAGVLSLHFARPRTPSAREQRLADLCTAMASVLAERDAATRRAIASARRLEVALDTSAVPFCLLQPVHDAAGAIRTFRFDYANDAAAQVLRRPVSEISGRVVREALVEGLQLDPELLPRTLEALRTHATVRFETWVQGGRRRRWFEVIERQVGHMAMLLDDLLDVSRITRGKLELRKAPIALAESVEAALEAARPLVESRQQQLVTDLGAEVRIEADRLRLAQVLSNLLTNASKYTPAGGRITLTARREPGWAVIEVTDNGSGIAPDALEAIFDMFTQVRGGDDSRSGGLGIGLALSRGLVELHGGRLEARSPGLGQGSTFTVRLPCPAAVAEAPAEDTSGAPAAGRVRRVLVADDNRDAAQSLADLLRLEGHEVAVAYDGEEALQQFGRFGPEVALLDIGMPKMTGNEVASAIRALPEGGRTLLVAVTGWGQERDRHAARAAGFDFHFTKPVDPLRVLHLLAQPGT